MMNIKLQISCSRDHASQFCVNKYPTRCNYTLFILSVNCSTCFRWFPHPSSGAQMTVSTASGTGQPLLLPVKSSTITTGRACFKCDGTRAETRFGISAKWMSPFKLTGGGGQFSPLLAAEVCTSAVVMLDTPCSEVV